MAKRKARGGSGDGTTPPDLRKKLQAICAKNATLAPNRLAEELSAEVLEPWWMRGDERPQARTIDEFIDPIWRNIDIVIEEAMQEGARRYAAMLQTTAAPKLRR